MILSIDNEHAEWAKLDDTIVVCYVVVNDNLDDFWE